MLPLRIFPEKSKGREGIEQYAESLLITALLNDRKLSYPRCYPQLIFRKTTTEPRTLNFCYVLVILASYLKNFT